MTMSEPRLRALLRRANKVASDGKRAAAAQVYRQIIEEAPQAEDAWLGLAKVTFDEEERETAYEQVLKLDPENEDAHQGLAILRGEAKPPDVETAVAPKPDPAPEETAVAVEPTPDPAPTTPMPDLDRVHVEAPAESDETLLCYRHPDRETALRCYSCGKPICSQCAVKTPVGYSCPDCVREKEDVFFNAKPLDYLFAPLVSFPLSLLAGFLVLRFSGGFFFILIMIFVGGLIGGFIGRISKRVIGNRRGRYLPHIVAATVVFGVLVPGFPILLALLAGNAGVLFALLGPGIYLFTATGAAFYQMK